MFDKNNSTLSLKVEDCLQSANPLTLLPAQICPINVMEKTLKDPTTCKVFGCPNTKGGKAREGRDKEQMFLKASL